MKKKYYCEICEVMHKETVAQYKMGHVSEADMREMDDLCLLKKSESPLEETPETGQRDLIEVL
jgi:DNA-binding transcriptional regulator YiaG